MNSSHYFAQFLGIYLLIIATIWLVRREQFEKAVRDIIASDGMFALSGAGHIIVGLTIILLHPVFTLDWQLKKQDLVIRIRSNGSSKTIALKSPRVELPSGATNRIELEFLSAEGEKVLEQLLSQGLKPNEASEKERWTFTYKECEIVLDKLPFIGSFIEIEGPSENAIHEVVTLLNLSSSEVVRKNYGELMKAKFHELQLPLSNIQATFANEIANIQ